MALLRYLQLPGKRYLKFLHRLLQIVNKQQFRVIHLCDERQSWSPLQRSQVNNKILYSTKFVLQMVDGTAQHTDLLSTLSYSELTRTAWPSWFNILLDKFKSIYAICTYV